MHCSLSINTFTLTKHNNIYESLHRKYYHVFFPTFRLCKKKRLTSESFKSILVPEAGEVNLRKHMIMNAY